MSAVADVIGVGTSELVAGATDRPEGKTYACRAYVIDGANGTVLRSLSSPNMQERGHFGQAVSVMETDGARSSLLVGAPRVSADGTDGSGRIYRFAVGSAN